MRRRDVDELHSPCEYIFTRAHIGLYHWNGVGMGRHKSGWIKKKWLSVWSLAVCLPSTKRGRTDA